MTKQKEKRTTADADRVVVVTDKGAKPIKTGSKLTRENGFWGGRQGQPAPVGECSSKRESGRWKGAAKMPKLSPNPVGEKLGERRGGRWFTEPPPVDD